MDYCFDTEEKIQLTQAKLNDGPKDRKKQMNGLVRKSQRKARGGEKSAQL
jgi:hypothetical protein